MSSYQLSRCSWTVKDLICHENSIPSLDDFSVSEIMRNALAVVILVVVVDVVVVAVVVLVVVVDVVVVL